MARASSDLTQHPGTRRITKRSRLKHLRHHRENSKKSRCPVVSSFKREFFMAHLSAIGRIDKDRRDTPRTIFSDALTCLDHEEIFTYARRQLCCSRISGVAIDMEKSGDIPGRLRINPNQAVTASVASHSHPASPPSRLSISPCTSPLPRLQPPPRFALPSDHPPRPDQPLQAV